MKKVLSVLLSVCMILPLFAVGSVSAAGFSDLAGHWAASYVQPLHDLGIISGKAEGIFDPEASVTRAEFLTMALKVAHIRANSFVKTFSDVSEGQWFATTVTEAQSREIIPAEMIADNVLSPDTPITREEMTAVLVRLWEGLRGNIKTETKTFTDQDQISSWAGDSVQKAVALGVVTGNPDGSFNPKANATRAEMAVMFKRLYDQFQTEIVPTAAGEYSPVYKGIIREDVDINKLIADAYASGAGEVTLPQGIFRVEAGAKTHIDLSNMENFTVHGNGATLLFQKRTKFGFLVNKSRNITVENLTVDYEENLYTQAEITGFDPDGFYIDLWVDPGYTCEYSKSDTISGDFYKADGLLADTANSFGFQGQYLVHVEGNHWRINTPRMVNLATGIEVGDYVVFRASDKANTFYIDENDGFHLRDVTIHGGDVGVYEGYGNETIRSTYERVSIIPGPAPLGAVIPRLTSTSGTGFHMSSLRESFTITDSIIYANGDDGTNIHGIYNRLCEKIGKNTYMLSAANIRTKFLPGDVLRFYTSDYALLDTATIVSAEPVHGYTSPVDIQTDVGVWTFTNRQWYKIVLDKEPTVEYPGWVVNEEEICNGFEIKNTTFANGRARGMLIKASGLIENCVVDRRTKGIMIAPELNWLESDYSDSVIVRNTTVNHCGFGGKNSITYGAAVHGAEGIDHKYVLFENCTFADNFGIQLSLSEAQNIEVINCTFKDSAYATAQIKADRLGTLTLKNNTFEGALEQLQLGENIDQVNQ